MREPFHRELDLVLTQLIDLLVLVRSAMSEATIALLDADLTLAEQVIAGEAEIDAYRHAVDDRALRLLARQQSVATDLRTIVAALRMSSDLYRMGRLARHVAEMAREAHPARVVPAELRTVVSLMSEAGQRIVVGAGQAITARDPDAAVDLEKADDELDRLHDNLYRRLYDGTWEYGTEAAVEAALIGRYYERYADHAVALARHIAFLAGKVDQGAPA
jgi:phosphate transport system protein